MSMNRILGVLLIAAGIVLVVVGINASHSVADRWSNFFTGEFTDSTVWYLISGFAAAALGSTILALGGRRAMA